MAGQIYGLVVDNEQSARLIMSRTVFQAGYTPICACDGHSGWFLAERLLPKFVITDLDMSPWGGLQLIQTIRKSADPAVRELPIIVCSATDDSIAIHAAVEAGATRFVAKPIRVAELRDLIAQVTVENRANLNMEL